MLWLWKLLDKKRCWLHGKVLDFQFRWHPTPVLLLGETHGWRSLVGCSPWGREKSDTTEWLHLHFSLSCIGEGNGNPLQCSCLENPRDGRARWAAVYGVAQSRTRLKRLSSSSRKVKKLGKWVPYKLTKNFLKKSSFWSVFSYSETQQQWTISQSGYDVWQKVDFIWQLVT